MKAAAVLAAVVLAGCVSGCAILTSSKEERLANSCYANGGKASVSYSETTGKVECR
jgi:hypothetical protein